LFLGNRFDKIQKLTNFEIQIVDFKVLIYSVNFKNSNSIENNLNDSNVKFKYIKFKFNPALY